MKRVPCCYTCPAHKCAPVRYEGVPLLVGVTPETDALGVLQDVHWSDGSFGYFPSYTLGAMYACQFHAKAKEEIDGFDHLVARGDLAPVREWLRAKIHNVGGGGDTVSQSHTLFMIIYNFLKIFFPRLSLGLSATCIAR